MKKVIAFLVAVFLPVASSVAEVLSFSPGVDSGPAAKAFLQEHPNVKLTTDSIWYETTSELAGAMLTQTFKGDIISLGTYTIDVSSLFQHGYCQDLSSDSIIADAIARMHPSIAQQVMYDGKIYGIPTVVSFRFHIVSREEWAECGYTAEDVPQSFPELLTFLDAWCDRQEADPTGYRAYGGFDVWYSPTSYIELLTGKLINEAVLQSGYANGSVYFDEATLAPLLEECYRIGTRLYQVEPPITETYFGGAPLFYDMPQGSWPEHMEDVVCFRLNESQPELIEAYMDMRMLYARADMPSLGRSYLEKVVETPEADFSYYQVMLYQDAEPKINPNNQRAIQDYNRYITNLNRQLARDDLTVEERDSLERDLADYQLRLESCYDESSQYLVSPTQLESYREYVGQLYFPKPDVFASSIESQDIKQQLIDRFAAGQITAQQFVSELNRVVTMAQLEDQ